MTSDALAPLPTAKELATFNRYKVMAFVTGGMLLLLCVSMLMRYVIVPDNEAVQTIAKWIAIVHGWIYVAYLVTVLDLWSKMRWNLARLVQLVLGGVIPVLSFVVEGKAKTWFDETVANRTR